MAAPPASQLEVRCGDAVVLVPAAAARELRGLFNRRDIAASIARRSGGELYIGSAPAAEAPLRRAAFLTLWAAALLVLVSAWSRRRA